MKTKKFFLLFFLMSISLGYATDYCNTPISSGNHATTLTATQTGPQQTTLVLGPNVTSIAGFPNTGGVPLSSHQFTSSPYGVILNWPGAPPANFNVFLFYTTNTGGVGEIQVMNINGQASCGPVLPAPTITFDPAVVIADHTYKTQGDAPFLMTATSNNVAVPITYSSSVPGVASINPSTGMVTINGAGDTVITASQVANGSYAAGSKTATLHVALAATVPAAGPTSPPARNTWDVVSQYSTAYTNQPGVIFDTFGGGATSIVDETLGDASVVKKYTGHSYSGISAGATTVDVSQMTHMHIDVWSPNFTSMRLKLEAHNGAVVTVRELDVPGGVAQGSWNSFDIPLSTYSSAPAGVDLTKLRWIVPVTFGQNATLYITNVYFYRPATTQPPTLGTFTVPSAMVGDGPITLVPPTSNSAGAWTFSSSNTAVAQITGTTLTIVGGGTSTITATQAPNGIYGQGVATATFTASYPAPGASPVPPARDQSNVFALFTGTPTVYDNDHTMIRADWSNGATTMTEVANGTNTALQVNNMGNLGYVTNGANFDISGMTKLHVDVYLNAPIPSLFVFLLAPGDNLYQVNGLTAGWNSLDIDLSNYPSANLANIYGLKFESNSAPGPFQMYLDNIYFYVPSGIEPTLADFNIPAQVFGNPPFELTPPSSSSAGAFTYTSNNHSVATIDGSTVTLHAPGTATITAHQAADGIYEAGSISAQLVVGNPPLAIAAPTPPARNEWDVISLYSNAYTPHSELAWQNLSTLSDVQLEGNDAKKMENFNIEIFTFTPANLTNMQTLHVDVYSEDCNGMNIWLLNNGDRMAWFNITPNQWNSIDIPMSTYTAQGLNPNGVFFLKFESRNGPGKTVYVDNIYFYRPETFLPPTITDFSIPAKAFGDADFEITPPTSNSAGAFTYTSSNQNVATIVNGNMIHIVGGGTSTITATQAADGGYGSGSITAQFVVSFPPPPASPVPPAREPERVISMFTGNPSVYANAVTTIAALFSNATTTEIPNGSNTALQLDNFGLVGLTDQAEVRFDVSGMSHLHLDVYLNEPLNANPALSRINVFLLANGDHLYQASNLTAGWNSLSIPLSNFPSADLTQVWGLKLESINAATTIYLDNIYFSNECYTYYEDADGDGYGNPAVAVEDCTGSAPAGYVLDNTDCNDSVGAIHPNAVEVPYNGVDDDCDGTIDETGTVTTT
ncbi:MopE-related protein, partial [Flavobacterium caeni]